MTAPQSSPEEPPRKLVRDLLELLPADVQQFLFVAAIPNAFTPTLIQRMSANTIDVTGSLETLGELSFLNVGQGAWRYLDADVRSVLNEHWSEPSFHTEFLAANQAAISYFEELGSRSPAPGHHTFQREVLYHRLLQNEGNGLAYLAQMFEACIDQYAYGMAQAYQEKLQATLSLLSSTAADHNAYYRARLDFIYRRLDGLDVRVEELMARTSDPLLRARAGVLLGQLWSAQYQWKKAVDVLQSSRRELQRAGSTSAAKAMLALGDVYVYIARYSGGWQGDSSPLPEGRNRLLYVLVFLPYLILDWFRRKIFFLPSLFYFSGNYQDWILNYLFRIGGSWYRKARRAAQATGDAATVLEATFRQAEIALHLRRETRAARSYSQLARLEAVRSSRYRSAQVDYGQGQVLLLAGRTQAARQKVVDALQVFREYEDEKRIADVACTLGEAELRTHQYEVAAAAWMESIRAYNLQNDSLAQTQAFLKLQELAASMPESPDLQKQVAEARDLTPEHHYLARFPSRLLDRFRSLAYLVALPISYLLTLIAAIAASLFLLVIETLRLQISGALTPGDILFLAFVALMPLPLTLWTIELVYCFAGQVWMLILARRSIDALGEEPDRLIVAPETITFLHSNSAVQQTWRDIKTLISANYRLWRRPISLFSRQILAAEDRSIVLEGITNAFTNLCAEVRHKVSAAALFVKADTVILASRWTFLSLFASWLHAGYLFNLGRFGMTAQHEVTCEKIPLVWSILFMFVIINWLIIFPPVLLWRVYWNRRLAQVMSGIRSRSLGNVLIFSAALVLTIIAVLWLISSPSLSLPSVQIGDSPIPEQCVPQQTRTGQAHVQAQTANLSFDLESASALFSSLTTVSTEHMQDISADSLRRDS